MLDVVEHGETVVITRDGVPVGRLVPEQRTSADRLKAALRDNPADAAFADDLERAHDDLRSAFGGEVRGWPGELSSAPASCSPLMPAQTSTSSPASAQRC